MRFVDMPRDKAETFIWGILNTRYDQLCDKFLQQFLPVMQMGKHIQNALDSEKWFQIFWEIFEI